MESFGDPFVLSEYRFYITLTGPLDATHLERVSQALWPVLEEICASGVTVDGLSLFGDCRRPLTHAADRPLSVGCLIGIPLDARDCGDARRLPARPKF